MKTKIAKSLSRYLNEIVGLMVMTLMTVALVAGHAGATVSEDVAERAATTSIEQARISP